MKDESVLETQHPALSTQHSSATWDSEQSAKSDMAVSVHPRNSFLRWPGRAHVVSDLMMLQCIAE